MSKGLSKSEPPAPAKVQVPIRLDPEQYDRLRTEAFQTNTPMQHIVVRALERYWDSAAR